MRVIFQTPNNVFRIVEHVETDFSLKDLKGDCFNPEYIKTQSRESLLRDEIEFENRVERDGVFGYELEKWNPQPDRGWEHVDSCWGFVGAYDSASLDSNHYIVDEMREQIFKSVEENKV